LGQCPSCGVVFKDLHASNVGHVSVLKSSTTVSSTPPGVWDLGIKDTRDRRSSPATADSTVRERANRSTRSGRSSGSGTRRLIIWGGAALAVAIALILGERML
jgi:hypothetical protein